MPASLVHIWRHPIKSHGREALDQVMVRAGETMPWDRTWAVAHERSKADGRDWAPCANFSRGAKTPTLQAIDAVLNEETETVTLSHPDLAPITFQPDTDMAAFLDWVAPLMDEDKLQSVGIVRVQGRGMTDSDFPSYSLNNMATHQAVQDHVGQELSPLRWRGNLWFDGFEPWVERAWIGKTIRVGEAEFDVREEIGRCKATMVDVSTGHITVDTLAALRDLIDDQNFGVYAIPTKSGRISIGDPVEVL